LREKLPQGVWLVQRSFAISANFGQFIADKTEKWAKVVKSSGAKPEQTVHCDTLLRCIIFSGRMSGLGQSATPTFATGMEEVASIADAEGYRTGFAVETTGHACCTPESRRQARPRVISAVGQVRKSLRLSGTCNLEYTCCWGGGGQVSLISAPRVACQNGAVENVKAASLG
jgi:hypothetical protein